MTGARDITQSCFSFNWAGIVANKIEQNFCSVYSYSGIESIEHTLNIFGNLIWRAKILPLPQSPLLDFSAKTNIFDKINMGAG